MLGACKRTQKAVGLRQSLLVHALVDQEGFAKGVQTTPARHHAPCGLAVHLSQYIATLRGAWPTPHIRHPRLLQSGEKHRFESSTSRRIRTLGAVAVFWPEKATSSVSLRGHALRADTEMGASVAAASSARRCRGRMARKHGNTPCSPSKLTNVISA